MITMMGEAPRSPISGVPGWETEAEERLLIQYAGLIQPERVILEIGAEFGRSAAALFVGSVINGPEIISVDLFPPVTKEAYQNNLRELFKSHRLTMIEGNSQTVPLPDVPFIDLLFIDGDHSYEGALSDLQRFTPLIRAGGYLLMHDCACATNRSPHPLHYEVSRALKDWRELAGPVEWTLLDTADSMMVYRRSERSREAQHLHPTINVEELHKALSPKTVWDKDRFPEPGTSIPPYLGE